MVYLRGYVVIFILLIANNVLEISPTLTWLICYIIIFLTVHKQNPFDPQAWLFTAWCFLFANYFSGVMITPNNLSYTQPVLYIIVGIILFHAGFLCNSNRNFKFNYRQVKAFLYEKYPRKIQNLIAVLGILSLLGVISIAIDLFVFHNLSFNGGDRRADLQEMTYSPFTTVGMILLGGCYLSALSLFFGGDSFNKTLGVLSLFSLSISSMCLAGKQGLLISVLIICFGIFVKRFYKINEKMPIILKLLLGLIFIIYSYYITSLSSERHENVAIGVLFNDSDTLNPLFKKDMAFLPIFIKNTFAEIFGYYGNQLGTFSERWNIDKYFEATPIALPPRILNPFTWLERQVIKLIPGYSDIYDLVDYRKWVSKQTTGYFSLANWQTTFQQGILIFGTVGHLIVIFTHGYYSRKLFERIGHSISFSTLNLAMINNFFLFYTIMMNFIGETSTFFCIVILGFVYLHENKSRNVVKYSSRTMPYETSTHL